MPRIQCTFVPVQGFKRIPRFYHAFLKQFAPEQPGNAFTTFSPSFATMHDFYASPDGLIS